MIDRWCDIVPVTQDLCFHANKHKMQQTLPGFVSQTCLVFCNCGDKAGTPSKTKLFCRQTCKVSAISLAKYASFKEKPVAFYKNIDA